MLAWALVVLYLSSPMLILVMMLRPHWEPVVETDPAAIPSSFLPYLISLVLCAALVTMVYFKTRESVTFFDSTAEGWTPLSSFAVLALVLGLVSASLVIWASTIFNRLSVRYMRVYSIAPRVFAAHRNELTRFVIYFYALFYFWVLGLGAVGLFYRDLPPDTLFVIAGRGSIPLAFSLVGSILQLPYSIFFVIAAGGYFYVLFTMTSAAPAILFMLVSLGSAGIYLIAAARIHGFSRR